VIGVSLASASAFAVSSSLKHVSAGQVPDAQDLGARSLGRFIRATLAHPLWQGGIGADVLGLSLQVHALHLGALAVVQPLLISGLLFALVLRGRSGEVVRRRELGWAGPAGGPGRVPAGGGHGAPIGGADHAPATAAAVTGFLLAGVCVLLGRRQPATPPPTAPWPARVDNAPAPRSAPPTTPLNCQPEQLRCFRKLIRCAGRPIAPRFRKSPRESTSGNRSSRKLIFEPSHSSLELAPNRGGVCGSADVGAAFGGTQAQVLGVVHGFVEQGGDVTVVEGVDDVAAAAHGGDQSHGA